MPEGPRQGLRIASRAYRRNFRGSVAWRPQRTDTAALHNQQMSAQTPSRGASASLTAGKALSQG